MTPLIELIRNYGRECHHEGYHSAHCELTEATEAEKSRAKSERKASQVLGQIFKIIGADYDLPHGD